MLSPSAQHRDFAPRRAAKSEEDDEEDDEEEEDEDAAAAAAPPVLDFRRDRGTIGLRVVTWNLEGREDAPKLQDVMPLSFLGERCIKAYALQEVRCLEQLRAVLWTSMGGKSEFELFEHWMGRNTPGSAGLTALLVFAPVELVRTGQFRLCKMHNLVKREVLNGQRFKFGLLGATTSTRGAVSMPFTFLDTTFSLCSLRLTEHAPQELDADQQQKDLDRILAQCCSMEKGKDGQAWRRSDGLHHVFAAGTFVTPSSSTIHTTSASTTTTSSFKETAAPKSRMSIRKSFFRGGAAPASNNSSSDSSLISPRAGGGNANIPQETRERYPALDDFEELDSNQLAYDSDHVFYRSVTRELQADCLVPLQSSVVKIFKTGRACVSTLFTLRGRSSELLSQYARVTGNLPLHLSTRSNLHVHHNNANARRQQRSVQRPKLSSAQEIRVAKTTTSTTATVAFVPHCFRCALPIPDSDAKVPVTLEGNAYHLACFTCDDCGQNIAPTSSTTGDAPFHEVDGKIYCPASYHKLFVNNCAQCHGALGEEFLVLPDGKRFHVSCYRCTTCSRPFATKQDGEESGIVIEAAIPFEDGYMCELDFDRLMGKQQCTAGCGKSFEQVVRVANLEAAAESSFCLECFWERFSARCFVCKLGIDDGEEVLEYGGTDEENEDKKPFCSHCACLQCRVCQRPIAEFEDGGKFVEFEGHTYCVRDWERHELETSCTACLLKFKPGQDVVYSKQRGAAYHKQCYQ